MSYDKVGQLFKRNKSRNTWIGFVFAFSKEEKKLFYTKSEAELKSMSKSIDLEGSTIYVPVDEEGKDIPDEHSFMGHSCAFEIVSNKRAFFLHSTNWETLNGWIKAFASINAKITFMSPNPQGLPTLKGIEPTPVQTHGKHGWLQKRGALNPSYKERYCRTLFGEEGNMILAYYKEPSTGEIQGTIPLAGATITRPPSSLELQLATGSRKFLLKANSLREADLWYLAVKIYCFKGKEDEAKHSAVAVDQSVQNSAVTSEDYSALEAGAEVWMLPPRDGKPKKTKIYLRQLPSLTEIVTTKTGAKKRVTGKAFVLEWDSKVHKSGEKTGRLVLTVGDNSIFRTRIGQDGGQFTKRRYQDQFKKDKDRSMTIFGTARTVDVVFLAKEDFTRWSKVLETVNAEVRAREAGDEADLPMRPTSPVGSPEESSGSSTPPFGSSPLSPRSASASLALSPQDRIRLASHGSPVGSPYDTPSRKTLVSGPMMSPVGRMAAFSTGGEGGPSTPAARKADGPPPMMTPALSQGAPWDVPLTPSSRSSDSEIPKIVVPPRRNLIAPGTPTAELPAPDPDQSPSPVEEDPWREVETPQGQKYYHNVKTNETAWTKPEIPKSQRSSPVKLPPLRLSANSANSSSVKADPEPVPAPVVTPVVEPDPWVETRTADGKLYYWNQKTNETAWSKPDTGAAAAVQAQQAAAQQAAQAIAAEEAAASAERERQAQALREQEQQRQEREEREEREKNEREAREKQEAKEKQEREAKEKQDREAREAREKQEQEAKERQEKEAQEAKERQEKEAQEAKAKQEQDAKVKEEQERKAMVEQEQKELEATKASPPPLPAPTPAPANDPWQEVFTPEGQKYYYNPTTGVTAWQKPVLPPPRKGPIPPAHPKPEPKPESSAGPTPVTLPQNLPPISAPSSGGPPPLPQLSGQPTPVALPQNITPSSPASPRARPPPLPLGGQPIPVALPQNITPQPASPRARGPPPLPQLSGHTPVALPGVTPIQPVSPRAGGLPPLGKLGGNPSGVPLPVPDGGAGGPAGSAPFDPLAQLKLMKARSQTRVGDMAQPSSPLPVASEVVPACSTCSCADFAKNAFKPGVCNNCFHKH